MKTQQLYSYSGLSGIPTTKSAIPVCRSNAEVQYREETRLMGDKKETSDLYQQKV